MSYFSVMPYMYYDLLGDGSYHVVKDVLRRAAFRESVKEQSSLYFQYDVKDTDSPEIIADKIYGSTYYHWVILLMNNIVDPYNEWPRNALRLKRYIEKKYGDNIDEVHHYEQPDGTWTPDPIYVGIIPIEGNPLPVTNRDFETAENEKKRKIKLLHPRYLTAVVEEFNRRIAR